MTRFSLLACLFIVGCGKFQSKTVDDYEFSKASSFDLIPSTDRVDSSCLLNSSYHSCIYLKNPVAQSKSKTANDADVTQRQIFGIRITDTDHSGFLQNDRLIVDALEQDRVSLLNESKKMVYSKEKEFVEQVMAYYWINRAEIFFEHNVGLIPTMSQQIRVYVGGLQSGWSSKDRALYISKKAGLSAEVMIALWGQANVYFASQGKSSNLNLHHVSCGLDAKGCCDSKAGCAKAIVSGIGDYFALLFFSDSPQIGEMLSNDPLGQEMCGKRRNVNDFATLNASEVYASCSEKPGWSANLGFLYSSVWWEVRRQAKSKLSVDQLFIKHLSLVDGSDDFSTLKAKILNLAPSYGADLPQLFTTQFQRLNQ